MIALAIACSVGAVIALTVSRGQSVRSIVVAWTVLAMLASGSIARTLLASEQATSGATASVSDFAVPADVSGLQGTSSLDTLERRADGAFVLNGWIFDERTHRPGEAMYVDLDGTARFAGTYGEARPDVATAFHSPALQAVGFQAVLAPAAIAPGAHRIRLGIVVGADRFESVRRYALTR